MTLPIPGVLSDNPFLRYDDTQICAPPPPRGVEPRFSASLHSRQGVRQVHAITGGLHAAFVSDATGASEPGAGPDLGRQASGRPMAFPAALSGGGLSRGDPALPARA